MNLAMFKSFLDEMLQIKTAVIAPAQAANLQKLFKAKPEVYPWFKKKLTTGGFNFQHPNVKAFQESLRSLPMAA